MSICLRLRWMFYGLVSAALLWLGLRTRRSVDRETWDRLNQDVPVDPRPEINAELVREKARIRDEVLDMHPIQAAHDIVRLLKERKG